MSTVLQFIDSKMISFTLSLGHCDKSDVFLCSLDLSYDVPNDFSSHAAVLCTVMIEVGIVWLVQAIIQWLEICSVTTRDNSSFCVTVCNA
jgi:hypothetical protein